MKNKLKEIRTQLRLSMNGIVSTSMREKGASYKLNFGVSIPQLKEIARTHEKSAELACLLWEEDVRELKILATLLYPIDSFTYEQAEQWAATITQSEIAEQYCFNLLQELPYAEKLASGWILRSEELIRVLGFLLYARLCMKGISIQQEFIPVLIQEAKKELDNGESRLQRAALLALKYYGRQSAENSGIILVALEDYPSSGSPEKEEFYEDLKFEFEYYR